MASLARDGMACVPASLRRDACSMMRDAAREFYDRVMVTVSRRDDLMHILENKGGFSTFKNEGQGPRGHGRSGSYDRGRLGPLSNAKWRLSSRNTRSRRLPAPRRRYHGDAQRGSSKWHSDGDHIAAADAAAAAALPNVFVPLVPCDVSNGGTEFVPGTHADWTASSHSYVLDAAPGGAVADWRLKHRPREQTQRRPAPASPVWRRPRFVGSTTSLRTWHVTARWRVWTRRGRSARI